MKFLISIICCLLMFTLPAAAEKQYNLDELIGLMKANDLLFKIIGIDQDISKEEYRIHRALPNPELEYSQGRADIPGAAARPSLWAAELRWSFPNPVHRYFSLKAERNTLTASQIEAEMRKRELVKGLKNHYFRLQFYKTLIGFQEEKLRILGEVNNITKAKVAIGESKEIDYLRSSVEIQKTRTYLFRVRKTTAYEKTKISEFLNYSLPDDFSTADDFRFAPLPGIEGKIHELIAKSPFILLKANRVEREKANLKAERFSIIEAVEIFGEREKEVEGKVWRVGIGISLPVFNWKSADIRKAKLQKQKAQTEFEHAKEHFFADMQRTVSEIRILENEIETFKGAILEEGRKNLELSETLYKEGEIPLVVFLDAQNSFFEVQERYYEAIMEWNLLKADLEELLGEEL